MSKNAQQLETNVFVLRVNSSKTTTTSREVRQDKIADTRDHRASVQPATRSLGGRSQQGTNRHRIQTLPDYTEKQCL